MALEACDNEVILSSPIGFVGYSADEIDYAKLPDDWNDANSTWSILTDKLLYCQSDTSDSIRHFSYDSLKAESSKQRFFDAA